MTNKNPNESFEQLREAWQVDQKLCCYQLIEILVQNSIDRVLVKCTSDLLQSQPPESGQLRKTGELLLDATNLRRRDNNFQFGYVGELALLQNTVMALSNPEKPSAAHEWVLPNSFRDWMKFFVFGDIDYRLTHDKVLQAYMLSRVDYPEAKERAAFIVKAEESPKPITDLSDYFWLCEHYSFELLFVQALNTTTCAKAAVIETGIVCELAADRLEGKPWPTSLNDSRFPEDPYTGEPYLLILTDDSVLICSPGPDGKSSGLEKEYNKTGSMGYGSGMPFSQHDDLVFRLPRAPYDAAAKAPAGKP